MIVCYTPLDIYFMVGESSVDERRKLLYGALVSIRFQFLQGGFPLHQLE
jgi:hypothetical protein